MPVRLAKTEDETEILSLIQQLGYSNVPIIELRERMTLYQKENHLLLVFEEHDRVLGFIALDVLELFHKHGKTGKITSLCVNDNDRGKGIGKALVQEAENFFRKSGCTNIQVNSNQRRKDAHLFYLALGYKQTSLKFLKEFPD